MAAFLIVGTAFLLLEPAFPGWWTPFGIYFRLGRRADRGHRCMDGDLHADPCRGDRQLAPMALAGHRVTEPANERLGRSIQASNRSWGD
jgi:hypothetical protein